MPPNRRRGGCLGRLANVILVLAVFYAAALATLPAAHTATQTMLLLPELIELPVRPLSVFTPRPMRFETTYGQPQDRIDIYVPADLAPGQRRPAVVLALGVHPPPIDAPEIVRVAEGIARLGVVVGVPDSSRLRDLEVVPEEGPHLADAALVVMAQPQVDRSRVGLAGFSAGASIALIAAADRRIAGELRWLSIFGAYAETDLLLVDVATRTMELDGEVRPWPADYGVRSDTLTLFLNALDGDPAEIARLDELLRPVVEQAAPPTGPEQAVVAELDGDLRQAYLLFTAPDRDAARAALGAVSARLRGDLDGISPVDFSADIEARVYLMHGEGDTAIPVSHAVALERALRDRTEHFARFGRFEHGQPGATGLALDDLPDIWQLWRYLHAIVVAATD